MRGALLLHRFSRDGLHDGFTLQKDPQSAMSREIMLSHIVYCRLIADCGSAGGGWTAGAPFNPIQAQGQSCGWDKHTGSSVIEWVGHNKRERATAFPFPAFRCVSTVPSP